MLDGYLRCRGIFSTCLDCSPYSYLSWATTTVSLSISLLKYHLWRWRLSIVSAASQMAQQMAQVNPGAAGANPFQPGQDPDKLFQAEAENLEVIEHWSVLNDVVSRMLAVVA